MPRNARPDSASQMIDARIASSPTGAVAAGPEDVPRVHAFTNYVQVTFFQGASLRPAPPGGTGKDARFVNIREDDLDEEPMTMWLRQAAALPGWITADIRM